MTRLDLYIYESQKAVSREKAKRLILEGKVTVNGKKAHKPSQSVSDEDIIEIAVSEEYVGRGALKLIKAFEVFPIDVKGKVCADIGASTGGFTQVLLKNGAEFVYAVDVGHGQLSKQLLENPAVKNCEGINVRYLKPDFFDKKIEFMCCDLSFISLRQTLPAMTAALEDGGEIVALIKPQFEAGRAAVNKNGLVKDKKVHIQTLCSLCEFFGTISLSLCGLDFSPIKGGDGNIEYLAYLAKSDAPPCSLDIAETVNQAFKNAGQW